jgi:hypothetical protein
MGIRQVWRDHKMLREIRTAAVEEVTYALKRFGDQDDVRHEVKAALNEPENEHYQEIRDEVVEQLNRWPALKSDQEMKERVSRTILESFMRVR